ncbi:MAG: cytochrome c biogenesis protein CcsA [Saprospiraceae bacterium]|nr:cytochrome c biogenesis protein CcsA [Saprospiraceae bacterium]
MQEINYIGEHLAPGRLGQFFLVLAFCAAALAAVAYYFATFRKHLAEEALTWKKIGRVAFIVKAISIFSAIGIMFFMMINKYYEYEYVWSHVADYLPFRYLFPAFWEGQQGSFLLWIFWHTILGFVLLRWAKSWETSTLAVLSAVQVVLISMILGVYLLPEFRLGVTPFNLLRESEGMSNLPIFSNANYLSMIEGKGLNPLLQNYWMIIHPPTLFLGFASVTIPFCFAIAGFWEKRYTEWLKPVLPWALFSGAILGTGIVMGGAWAYEALSFGGYWAWDPVENASLVPWLILIGGIHTNLVARSTKHSIKGTFIFYALSFIFILYSTFLTRSGILGDSSVHAFTEMGLEWQLVILIALFTVLPGILYVLHHRSVPTPEKEESMTSREFWMFIGSLVLLFSAGLITFTTSLPVLNKLMDVYGTIVGQDVSSWHKASPADPISHYNKYQVWIAFFIGMLTGITQFLIYRGSNWPAKKRTFYKNTLFNLALSAVVSFMVNQWIKADTYGYILLLFSAVFAIVSNLQYLVTVLKFKWKASASIFSHVGFGLMVLGVLASGINKTYISNNEFAMRGIFSENDERLQTNVYLIKGEPLYMGGFLATYVSDTMIDHERTYRIKFDRLNEEKQEVQESFELTPFLTYNAEKTEMVNPNPSTKRYLDRDIFSHITAAPSRHISLAAAREEDDSLKYQTHNFRIGETKEIGGIAFNFERVIVSPVHKEYVAEDGDLAYGAEIVVWDSVTAPQSLFPVLAIKQQKYIYSYFDASNKLGVRIRITEEGLNKVYPDEQSLSYETYRQKLGDSFYFDDHKITIAGFDKDPVHPSYIAKEGDIAVAVRLEITTPDGFQALAKPIFLIRDNRTYMIRDYLPNLGLTLRFSSIDPNTEELELMVAKNNISDMEFPVEIALDAPRDDYIVLAAIEFPGINLFWIGTTLMMLGMLMGMWRKIRLPKRI